MGRMLTEAALPMGFKVIVVDPSDNCPAAQAGAEQIKADFYDAQAIEQLAAKADYVTVESEHINTDVLERIAEKGKPVNPAPQTVALIQDKLLQKRFLQDAGIPVADFAEIVGAESASNILAGFDGKMVVKTRTGGYDGYGNRVVTSPAELDSALRDFQGKDLYAERFVPFEKELAVMAVRDQAGEIVTYPVVETIQQNNVCHEVLAPAAVQDDTRHQAEKIALQVAREFDGAGAFGVELFLAPGGSVLVNEIAPRVHNSGHYTIEACQTSQFENHVRAITGLPLGSTSLKVPAAVMVNILGYREGPAEPGGIEAAEADGHTKVHIYGKAESRIGRKMGHLTSVGDTVEAALEFAEEASESIHI